MSVIPPAPPAPAPEPTPPAGVERGKVAPTRATAPFAGRLPVAQSLARHCGLAVAVALSAVLNTHRLAQNGYANIFYSAGDRSMLLSLHNFLFASFDPGGLISVDKPPLGLWLQVTSAKLFGFAPLSLLLPEAICGVLAVALLYVIVARRLGPLAASASAIALAVFPSFVAVSRDTGVDSLLILLMLMACAAGVRATETGRLRWLLACGVLVGLAFNTKTLAAYLVVPGVALAYVVCAAGSLLRRCTQLAAAGLVMVVVSFAWIAFVELTPASERPYVGSSTNNTELGLTFAYNGFGRVGGQVGGPGNVIVRPGATVPAVHPRVHVPRPTRSVAPRTTPSSRPEGREKNPIPFGSSPGPVRLFSVGLGDQDGWFLPFAAFGLIALAALLVAELRATRPPPERAGRPTPEPPRDAQRQPPDSPAAGGRRDPRVATVIVLGGWFLVEAVLLSTSKGIVHPYYVSALGPGTAAMAGAGAVALVALARGAWRAWGLALAACGVVATVAVQVLLMHREHYMLWFVPLLVAGGALGIAALAAARRAALPAIAFTFGLLLVVPTAYASTTWLAPVEGTFPAAGPKHDAGPGGYGVNDRDLGIDRALLAYARSHDPGSRWDILTVASDTSAPLILMGGDAGAVGGYGGNDPALDGAGLARLVASHQARYVLLGGEYSLRGGNGATRAVLRACDQLAPSVWHSPVAYPFGLVLFDCAGRTRALAAS